MTKGIIFDADGMLVHGERFSARLERDYGIGTDVTSSFFHNEFQLCLVGKADLKEELAKHIEAWGWQGSVEDLLAYWFVDDANRIDDRFKSDITELRARGIKAYLATNNEKYRTADLVERRGLGPWFDAVFSSADVGFKKPEAAFFQHILDQTGTQKEELVFWDDDPENTDGAAAFGLPIELYTDFDRFKTFIDSDFT